MSSFERTDEPRILPAARGVAQLGRAPALGAGGRWFKSSHPDCPEFARRAQGNRSFRALRTALRADTRFCTDRRIRSGGPDRAHNDAGLLWRSVRPPADTRFAGLSAPYGRPADTRFRTDRRIRSGSPGRVPRAARPPVRTSPRVRTGRQAASGTRYGPPGRHSFLMAKKNPPKQRWEPLRGEGREEAQRGLVAGGGVLRCRGSSGPRRGSNAMGSGGLELATPLLRKSGNRIRDCPIRGASWILPLADLLTRIATHRFGAGPRSAEAGPG